MLGRSLHYKGALREEEEKMRAGKKKKKKTVSDIQQVAMTNKG